MFHFLKIYILKIQTKIIFENLKKNEEPFSCALDIGAKEKQQNQYH